MRNFDGTFKDEDLVLKLLFSLPKEYKFIETILLYGKEKIFLSEICSTLYSHELRKKDSEKNNQAKVVVEALIVRGRPQG